MAITDEELAGSLAFADKMEMRRLELEAEEQRVLASKEYDYKIAREATRQSRWESLVVFLIGVFAVAAILGLSYIIWQGNKGPGAEDVLKQEFRLECVKSGGTFLSDTNGGKCIAGPGSVSSFEESK